MNGNRHRRIEWFSSVLHPKRMIASPTLASLRALLTGRRSANATHASPPGAGDAGARTLCVPLAQVPGLHEVGGVAMVMAEGVEAVGIARVGRTSFVGFKLDGEAMREIEVELDETSGSLRITPALACPAPLLS
jgi:hypothetical protein